VLERASVISVSQDGTTPPANQVSLALGGASSTYHAGAGRQPPPARHAGIVSVNARVRVSHWTAWSDRRATSSAVIARGRYGTAIAPPMAMPLRRLSAGRSFPTDALAGPLITATTVLGLNALMDVPFVAHPLYLACVAYSVFRGGVASGLASTALVVADSLLRSFDVPLGLEEPFQQVKVVALACLMLVLVTGHLKRRADRAHELSQANQQLTGQLIERARSEEAALGLAMMTRELVEPLDVGRVHHRIVATILDLFRVRRATLYWLDTAAQELVCVAAAGDVDGASGLGRRVPAGTGIVGRAVREHRLIAAEALREDPDTLALPLRARGKVLGALTVGLAEGKTFGETELQLLSIFAGHAALALENSRLYEDLRATLDRLSESQARLVDDARLRASEEVAAGVAHHVNNRLMIILAGIQLLMPKLASDVHRTALEIVERTVLDTARLVDRLRQFTMARPRGAADSADLNLAVQRAVELCHADHAEAETRAGRIEIDLELGSVPRVVGDEALLEEALGHIVRNAIEAVADGGRITITTSATGTSVLCAVRDTGPGMPDDVVQRAAEPFFTTKGPQRAGLGLSSALGIMRQLGGQLDVQSQRDVGTRVTVRLRPYVS
jgi:signal transduction histidine kinase